MFKLNVWIPLADAQAGVINEYHYYCPFGKAEYVQVVVDHDQFVKMEDEKSDRELVEQYNRNRPSSEWITNVKEIPNYGKA